MNSYLLKIVKPNLCIFQFWMLNLKIQSNRISIYSCCFCCIFQKHAIKAIFFRQPTVKWICQRFRKFSTIYFLSPKAPIPPLLVRLLRHDQHNGVKTFLKFFWISKLLVDLLLCKLLFCQEFCTHYLEFSVCMLYWPEN